MFVAKGDIMIKKFVLFMLPVFLCLSGVLPALAGNVSSTTGTNPAQAAGYNILVVSESNITEALAGKFMQEYRDADAALIKKIVQDLQERGYLAGSNEAGQGESRKPSENILTVKLEHIEFGMKTPFGQYTTVKASYEFQRMDGFELRSGEHETSSSKDWKNCTKALGHKIATDAVNTLAGKFKRTVKGPEGKKKEAAASAVPAAKKEKTGKSTAERLQELDALNAKGLVTPDEYKKKREDILKEL